MARSDYIVRKVELQELHSIRDSWKRLECGPDMTFFQKYEWNETVAKFVPAGKGIERGFFVVDKEGDAVMIAPLWIITRTIRLVNRPGVFLIGRKGYSDYLNLIYDVFDEVAFQALAEYVRTHHGVKVWHFEYLRESALLSHVRQNIGRGEYAMKHEASATYCGLSLSSSADGYEASLSKGTRQNIRTAVNRCKRDGLDLVVSYDDDGARRQCDELRSLWQRKKGIRDRSKISWKGKVYLKLRWLFYERSLVRFPRYSPMIDSRSTRILSIKDGSTGEIAAFFCYGLDIEHRTITVITAGVNEKFSRYSPGFVCIKDFICHCINEGNADYLDFTRGTEPYKYWLGCKNIKVSNISVTINSD